MIRNSPDPVDVQDIQFKLHCKLKVFNNKDLSSFPTPHNLISCASRYGFLFVGGPTNLQVIQVNCLENYSPKDRDISNYPRRIIALPSSPKHLCVNCDSTILAVVIEKEKCPTTLFYDVLSFYKENVSVVKEVRLSANPETYVSAVNWNPSLPGIFTACKSDGTLGVYEIKDNSVDINELPPAAEATSFCWSPKGKQIAVGSKTGKITQYKPDLKAVKVIGAPPLEGPHSLIALQWISNYQFLGIYQPFDLNSQPKVIVIDAPKTGETIFTNYDDVCYSGSGRIPQFFIIFQQHWNVVMVASSNSTEVAVLGFNPPETWTQWILSDSARAELPLSSDHQETFPVGLAFDISNTQPLPWGESTIPPCPYLLILSHQGVLCIFSVVNLKELPSLCTPPDPVKETSGLKLFVTNEQISIEATETPKSTTIDPPFQQMKPTFPTNLVTPLTQSKQSAFVPPATQNTLEQNVLSNLQSTPTLTQASRSPQPLFGGQASITPIKPQFSNKPVEKSMPADKYASIFSSLNAPVPTVTFEPPKPAEVSFAPPKPTKNIEPAKEIIAQPKTKSVDIDKTDIDALLKKMIQEECISVESELNALLHKGRTISVNIGTEEEKLDLINSVKALEEFIKEIVDVSLGEIAEVHALKQNLVLSWAWYEEALSHYNSTRNKKMDLLIRSRPLDSATEKRYNEIKKLTYYIESQLQQVCKELDEQWDKFQGQIKKTHRIQMPTMEAIFQTMVRQSGILQKQSYIMKDISLRLKHKVNPLHSSALLVSKDTSHDIEAALEHLQLVPEDSRRRIFENINSQSKSFTKTKTKKLGDLLRNRKVTHVTVVKPQFSPLNKQMLAAKMTPLSKELSKKKLDFSTLSSGSVNMQPQRIPSNMTNTSSIPSNNTTTFLSNVPSAFAHINPNAFTIINVRSANSEKPTTTTPIASLPSSLQSTVSSKSSPFVSNVSVAPIKQSIVPPIRSGISFGEISPASSSTNIVSVSNPVGQFTSQSANVSSSFSFTSPTPMFSNLSKPTSIFGTLGSTTTNEKTPSIPHTTTNKPAYRFPSSPTQISTTASSKNIFGFAASTAQSVSSPVSSISKTPITTTPASINSSKISQNLSTAASNNLVFSSPITVGRSIFGSASSSLFKPSSTTSSTTSSTVTVAISKVPEMAKSVTAVASTVPTNLIAAQPKTITSAKMTETPASSQTSIITSSSPADSQSSSLFAGTSITPTTTTITTSQTSVFKGDTVTPVTKSIFGLATVTTPSPTSSSVAATIPTTTTSADTSNISTNLITATTTSTISAFSFIPASANDIPAKTQSTSPLANLKGPSTTSSIFGQAIVTTESSIFGQAAAATSTSSIFGQTKTTMAGILFGQATLTTTASVFGQPSTTATTTDSVFGQPSTPASTTDSIFGQPASTTSSIFKQPATTTSTTGSLFGQPALTAPTTSSIFGQPTTTASTASSIFGQAIPTTTVSLFVQPTTTATTTGSIFGQVLPTTTGSIFGQATTPSSSVFGQASVFGQKSIFGQTTSATTTSSVFAQASQANTSFGQTMPSSTSSIFGQTATTPSMFSQTGSLFGQTTTAASPIFGQNTASNSVFGQTAATTASSVFGTTAKTTPSVFGQASPAFGQTTATSTFGSTNSPFGQTTQQNSIFGQTTASTVFGQPSSFGTNSTTAFNTTTTSSIFGTNTSSVPATFGTSSPNTFGSSAPFASNSGTTSGNSFSFGSLNIGNASTTSSVFGTNNTATTNPFGGTSIFGTSSPSSTTGSIFGSNTSSTSASIFGSSTPSTTASIFGSKLSSTFGSNNPPAFGTSTFGPSPTYGQQSSFGRSSFGNTSFGSPQAASGPFSSGGTAVGQTGFGSPTSFAKPSGFGAAPVFGGSPAFGSSPSFGGNPSFGGAPAFGAAPSFGSPNKVFGSSTTTAPAFGSPNTATAGFGNLASQNTLSFGNLAQQQSNSPSSTPFSGNSSFSSWR